MNFDWHKLVGDEDEKPLDRLPVGLSETSIFRSICCVGSSMAAGEMESVDAEGKHHFHDWYDYSWGQHLGRKTGSTIRLFARGGMAAKTMMETHATNFRAFAPENACQAYIIELGANDLFYFKQEVGTVADIDVEDSDTIAHYYGQMVKHFKAIQPRAKFFFVTVPRYNDERDERRLAHTKMLYEMAEYFDNAYVIDWFHYGPVYDKEFIKQYFLNGHMSASGYLLKANLFDAYIDYIIRHNPDDFRKVAFIGTELD